MILDYRTFTKFNATYIDGLLRNIDETGRVITEGAQVMLGGNDSYVAMCHSCWKRKIREQQDAGR